MIPTYVLWIIALFLAIKYSIKKPSNLALVFKSFIILIIAGLAYYVPSLLPVFKLPQPTGKYSVGTNDLELTVNRDEIITENPNDKRSFMIKTWYPTTDLSGKQDLYIDKGGRNGFAMKYGLPISMLDYLDQVDTHVYRNAAIENESFPVLLFSHGYNSKANGYYALLSEVASHGYIVFAINHTYESTGSTFIDGKEVYFDNHFAQKIETDTWQIIVPIKDAFKTKISFEERQPIVKKALTTYFVKDIVNRWAQDIVDVSNVLQQYNSTGFFKDKLDMTRIGVFGHSRGGGAAGHSLLLPSSIKAGVNLDGVQWGEIADTTFQKPFMFVAADWPEEHENLNQHAYINKSSSYFYEGLIKNSAHSNFMDIPYMVPEQSISEAGTIQADMAISISSSLVTSFFDKHLKEKPIDLLLLNSEFELLELKVFEGDSIRIKN
ncbi:MAG: hypothetical protein BM564_03460 [Bacteroidetes bacterium MedPE-SWsnd-G2]|nr:MAG: hypothetical protein BM564_03460 [Bacteroidetes bacterium MedPE-SWsnd-G2]